MSPNYDEGNKLTLLNYMNKILCLLLLLFDITQTQLYVCYSCSLVTQTQLYAYTTIGSGTKFTT